MTTLTLLTLLVVTYGMTNKQGYGRALALGGATAAGSAAYVAGVAIPTFYATAIVAAGLVAARTCLSRAKPAGERARCDPGVILLLAFLFYALLVTLIAPLVLPGTPTVTPVHGVLVPGVLTGSNVAQLIYLVLGIAVLLYLRGSRGVGVELVGLAAGTCTVLSAWRYLSQMIGLPFPEGLFDNSPSFAYIETAAGGVPRFRGILSEPAGLATSCLVTIFYMIPRARQVRGWRRAGSLVLTVAALYMGTISTSTTFLIGGFATLGIVIVVTSFGFLSRRISFSSKSLVLGAVVIIVLVWVLPLLYAFVSTAINGKIDSSSYIERSGSNQDALNAFFSSYGFGLGVGSVRASSFVPTLLGATGAFGAALFVTAVVIFMRRGASRPELRPVVWVLVVFLVVKVTAGPDLSDSSGILWISLGLLSRPHSFFLPPSAAPHAVLVPERHVPRRRAPDRRFQMR